MTRIAMCPGCHVPLVATLAFSKAEFYCLDCGAHLGWLEPSGADETPELLANMEARKMEWVEHAGRAILTRGAWHEDCEKCKIGGETHVEHATDAELAAHDAARAWLRGRMRDSA